jgi:hypothetical protein
MTLTTGDLKTDGKYNWKHAQEDKLIYVGREGAWYQFKKIDDPRPIWCEVLAQDIHMLEETKE